PLPAHDLHYDHRKSGTFNVRPTSISCGAVTVFTPVSRLMAVVISLINAAVYASAARSAHRRVRAACTPLTTSRSASLMAPTLTVSTITSGSYVDSTMYTNA